jgi:type II secretory pathway component PulC
MGQLGLQQGDVITWINGADLDNRIKAMQALKSISSGDYVNMTVIRNGLDTSLSFYMP